MVHNSHKLGFNFENNQNKAIKFLSDKQDVQVPRAVLIGETGSNNNSNSDYMQKGLISTAVEKQDGKKSSYTALLIVQTMAELLQLCRLVRKSSTRYTSQLIEKKQKKTKSFSRIKVQYA